MTPPQRRRSARLAVAVAPAVDDDDDDDDDRSTDDLRRENADLRRACAALEEELRSLREAARSPSLLERFTADARDVFAAHVLSRLDEGDLAVLATVNRKMRDVVFESDSAKKRCVWNVGSLSFQLSRVRNFVGSIARLVWAWERGCPRNAKTFECIAKAGNLDVAKWAKERGCPWDATTCFGAAGGGHMEMLQWLRANGAPWDT
jgi:hypothetical protein